MTSAKTVVLTAIYNKGVEQVTSEAKELAENLLVSVDYVKNIIRQVKKGRIIIK